MGGKSYFCDYCCCYLKNDVNVRKVHNSGLAHNIAKNRYFRQFDDPRKILEEESAKKACTFFFRNNCLYDLACQNSHYSNKHIEDLREIVRLMAQKSGESRKKKSKIKKRGVFKMNLPPSLKSSTLPSEELKINMNKWG